MYNIYLLNKQEVMSEYYVLFCFGTLIDTNIVLLLNIYIVWRWKVFKRWD